jgi:fimbrial chaperone protein
MVRPIARYVVGGLVLLTCFPEGARSAANFGVHPVSISLTERTAAATVTIRNNDDSPLRLQLAAFDWRQGADGAMVLERTEEVAFFPRLLTLGPREARSVRVATTARPGHAEKSYRLFIEELPPLRKAGDAASSGVRMLVRYSIPLFLKPANVSLREQADVRVVTGGELSLAFTNQGNVHVPPRILDVQGVDQRGGTVFSHAVAAGYNLPGGSRTYAVPVPAGTCGVLRAVVITAQGGAPPVRRPIDAGSREC